MSDTKPTVNVTTEGYTTTFPDGCQCIAKWDKPVDAAEKQELLKLLVLQAEADWADRQAL